MNTDKKCGLLGMIFVILIIPIFVFLFAGGIMYGGAVSAASSQVAQTATVLQTQCIPIGRYEVCNYELVVLEGQNIVLCRMTLNNMQVLAVNSTLLVNSVNNGVCVPYYCEGCDSSTGFILLMVGIACCSVVVAVFLFLFCVMPLFKWCCCFEQYKEFKQWQQSKPLVDCANQPAKYTDV